MSLTDNTQSFPEDQTLQKFGYQQVYKRELKRFASFAVGFSFISSNGDISTKELLAEICDGRAKRKQCGYNL